MLRPPSVTRGRTLGGKTVSLHAELAWYNPELKVIVILRDGAHSG